MGFLWFVLGLIIGAAGIWVLLSRKSDERVAEIERSLESKVQHAQDDAFQADRAHHETKERLIALQLQHTVLEKRLAEAEAARAPASPAVPAAPTPAAATSAPPRSVPAQRLKAIEAKLAQLPAGSSARAALLREHQELTKGATAKASPTAPASDQDGMDGLRRIKGIGPSIERQLKDLGVKSVRDLAALDEAGIARIDEALDFKGRVSRERWVEQARELLGS